MGKIFKVAGIGELLWDLLPDGRQIGGAPFNFAYHSNQLGSETFLFSAVGTDLLGKEIILKAKQLGVNLDFIQVNSGPTSCVDIELDGQNNPSYIINENVAWDYLLWDNNIMDSLDHLDAVCFGSLAQRNPISAKTINTFLNNLKPDCIKVLDINLRQNYYSEEVILRSLKVANVLKMNSTELEVLTSLFNLKGDILTRLYQLQDLFRLDFIACTLGKKGSYLIDNINNSYITSPDIQVVDTVGAGDAFTATLVNGMLNKMPLKDIHSNATKMAAFVCTQSGSTPNYYGTLNVY